MRKTYKYRVYLTNGQQPDRYRSVTYPQYGNRVEIRGNHLRDTPTRQPGGATWSAARLAGIDP